MKVWRAVVTTAAILAAGSAGAATDNAREKGGGSSGGSSAAGARHHSGGGSGSPSHSSSSSMGERSSPDHTPTPAQLRHPRAGTGTGHHNGGYGYYNPYYYNPYFYGYYGYGLYAPFYYPYYGYGYGYGPGYGPNYGGGGGYSSYREGSVRVQVEPSQTRVYVDGYYAGVADDFDGIFQRLHVSPGRHDISLRLEGYVTRNLKLYVSDDDTIKVQHRMVKGEGEEDAGVVGRPEDYARFEGREERPYDREEPPEGREDAALVRLDVRPADASVYVDDAFRGTGRELRELRLTPGRHRIEVVRPGRATVQRDVVVQPGQAIDVQIDLDRS